MYKIDKKIWRKILEIQWGKFNETNCTIEIMIPDDTVTRIIYFTAWCTLDKMQNIFSSLYTLSRISRYYVKIVETQRNCKFHISRKKNRVKNTSLPSSFLNYCT